MFRRLLQSRKIPQPDFHWLRYVYRWSHLWNQIHTLEKYMKRNGATQNLNFDRLEERLYACVMWWMTAVAGRKVTIFATASVTTLAAAL